MIAMRDVLHIITGLNDGGAESALYRLCINDTRTRHHVLSLMDAGRYGPLLAESGIPVATMNIPRGGITMSGLWRLWRHLRQRKYDAIQTWMYHSDLIGGTMARLSGHANVNWGIHHSDLGQSGTGPRTVTVARLCATLSRLVPRHIVCCARRSADVHAAFGYDRDRMTVIPNGYDLSVFRPDPVARQQVRDELAIDAAHCVIGFVARYDPLKDHANLLAALARVRKGGRHPVCLLIGTDMDHANAALITQLDRSGLADTVRLLGQRNDVPRLMNALDVHILSSSSEAFPNVLAEAMACGRPCISTDVGDASEIVGDSGWIVPPRDDAALGEAIATAIDLYANAPDAWRARQAAARAHVEANFSIDRMVSAYSTVWFGDEAGSSSDPMRAA